MGPAGDGLGPSEDLPGKGRVNSQVTTTQREVKEGLTLEQENSPNSHPTPSSDPETAHHGDRVALSGKETKFLPHLSLWPCGCLSEMSLPQSPQNSDPEATFPGAPQTLKMKRPKLLSVINHDLTLSLKCAEGKFRGGLPHPEGRKSPAQDMLISQRSPPKSRGYNSTLIW